MSQQAPPLYPLEISLHTRSRLLVIVFSDDRKFELPAEYLRVFSRAAEVRTLQQPEHGKEDVNILAIEPQGEYGIQISFDDGHDTSIYSWKTLYSLGDQYQSNWQDYLQRLADHGIERDTIRNDEQPDTERKITLLYFAWLANKFGRESETLSIPAKIITIDDLLDWLRLYHHRERAYILADELIRITVNKQFSRPTTRIDDGDEIAFVPTSPTAPAAPK